MKRLKRLCRSALTDLKVQIILAVAIFVLVLTVASACFGAYEHSKVSFDPKGSVDCSDEAKKRYNLGAACAITVKATSNVDKSYTADFGEMSGPGYADWSGEPEARIYDKGGHWCYADVFYVYFSPKEVRTLWPRCTGANPVFSFEKRDLTVDQRPAYVTVNGRKILLEDASITIEQKKLDF